ncbi:MAG TPA: carboxypeptidase-like regulatory domain-containing protein [Terracidiphilus sp.]
MRTGKERLRVMCRTVSRGLLLACIAFAGWGQLRAQSSNAQISGIVTDPSGSAVPGVEVSAVNGATGVPYTTQTNGAGVYVLSQLVPGTYAITISRSGFGNVVRSGLVVRTGDSLAQNITLTPGAVQQTVTVTGTAPLISSDQASTSTVLDNKMITELPQLNRNTLDLTAVIPSVQGTGPLSDNIASLGNAAYLLANHGNSYSLSGGQVNGTSITVDGNQVQDSEFNASNRSIPTPDSIGEFRVDSGVLTANYGRYSGGVISMETQSGTNDYHGRVFEYFRNQILNSNDWANNANGVPRQAFHQNNYGVSTGGPISIPHVYSGKNRTFFYFGWEGERFSQAQNVESTVPTLLNRQGNFSQTIINHNNGVPVYANIYDPFHGADDGQGNWVRPQYPGSTIPVNPMGNLSGQSQLFQRYLSLWPEPNHAPDSDSDHNNNYWSTIHSQRPTDRFFFRLDENISNNHRINFNISRSFMTNTIPAPFFHAGQSVTTDDDWSGGLQYNWVLSPTSILDAHLGFGTAKLISNGVSGYGSAPDPKIDVTKWGFDPLIVNNNERSVSDIPPALSIPGYTPVGGSEFDSFINQTTNGTVAFTKVLSRHTIKVGYEQYFYRFDESGGDHTGVAWVNPGGGSNQTWNNNDGNSGSPLAELMMGSSNFFQWGNWNITPFGWNQAAYAMDDWKVNSKLTVQMGLRWDHDGGRQGRHPQGSLMYDINAKNVLQSNGSWNWSQVTAAVPELAGLGSPQWISQGATGRVALLDTKEYPQKNLYTTDWLNFQPRLGISYQLDDRTVLHGSGGIVYQGLNGLSTDYFSFYYNSNTFNQIPSLDGQHWISEFGDDHGLGTFPLQPSGANLGFNPPVTTNAGYWYQTYGGSGNPDQGGSSLLPHYDSPEDYMWSLGVQRQVGQNWLVSAEYQGIRGIHLLMPVSNWSLNNVPLQYYKLGSKLQDQVPNPFYGQSQTFASQPTVPLYQLLGLSPQYQQVSPGQAAWGKSFSNFFNIQIETRSNHGFTFLASYAIRKTLTNTGGKDIQHSAANNSGILQDPHNLMEGYGLALYEKPQTMKLNYSYDLPFGRGRQFLGAPNGFGAHVLDGFIGGWGVAGITIWDPKGVPVLMPKMDIGVTAPGAALRWSLANSNYQKSSKSYGRAVFVRGSFTNPDGAGILNHEAFSPTPDYGLSNAPFVFPNLRAPGDFSTDATLLKKFQVGDNAARYLETRIEATNVFNHPTFGTPNQNTVDADPDSPTFGGINGKNGSRIMQIGLRLFF